MELLTQNTKLKATSKMNGLKVMNFGITAGVSCPQAGACAKFCYAKKGAYRFGNVKPVFAERLEITKRIDFPELMWQEIVEKSCDVVRIHDSGDFYNREYLSQWLKVIESLPHVQFYAYTKSHDLIDEVIVLPENFIVIKSEGGKLDYKIDRENDRHSKIFPTLDELLKAGYIDTSENDLNAIGTNKKIGLLIH